MIVKKYLLQLNGIFFQDNFEVRLQYRIASLRNQLHPEFASKPFKSLHRCNKRIQDVHLILYRQKIFGRNTAFLSYTILRFGFN